MRRIARSLGPALTALALLGGSPAPAPAASAWTATGPGTVTIASNGTSSDPQMSYALSGSAVWSRQTWTFSTTATQAGSVKLPYNYSGFHAWFMTLAFLEAYVTGPSGNTTIPLFSGGVGGGFNLSGEVTLSLQPGDVYGFRFGGSNYDADSRLLGTLKVTAFVAPPPVNQPPTANADAATTAEDTPVSLAVTANDTDPEGDALTVTAVTQGTNGTVTLGPSGTVTYAPRANFNGSDTFTYTLSDGKGNTATGTVTVTVTPVNDPPVATADSAVVQTRGTVTVDVRANDVDPDGDALTVTGVSSPAYGTATISGNQVSYRNNGSRLPSYDEVLTYTITDGHGGSATATVKLRVVARLPVLAIPRPLTVKEGMPLRFTVRAKDPNSLPAAALRTAVNTRTLPRGASFRNDTLSWTPMFNQAGRYKLLFGARSATTPSRTVAKAVEVSVRQNRYPNLIVGGQPSVKSVPVYRYETTWELYSYWYWQNMTRYGRDVPGYTGRWHYVLDSFGNIADYERLLAEVRTKQLVGYTTTVVKGEKTGFEIRKKDPVTTSTAFRSFSSGLLRSWKLPSPPYAAYAKTSGITRPAVGNLDGVRLSEVVVGAGSGSGGLLTAYSPTGRWTKSYRIAWSAYAKANGETWPAMGDLNRDGKAEIAVGFGKKGGGRLNLLEWTGGQIRSKGWLTLPDTLRYNRTNGTTRPAVGDLTGDRRAEIVVGVDGYGANAPTRVWIYTPSGSTYRAIPLQIPAAAGLDSARFNCETWPAIGDLDGDGRNELVVNLTKVVNGVRKPVGFGVWSFTVANGRLRAKLRAFKKASTFGPPGLGDVFTPDGKAEIVLREGANKKSLSVFKVAVSRSGRWTITRAGSVNTGQRNPYPALGSVSQ